MVSGLFTRVWSHRQSARIGELDSHTRRPWIINDNFANNLSDNEVNVPTAR
ncbi:hypothetical protein STM14_3342 [Salmonella enterica subsp. enterica serovar Typhimurium str. 14028S]|uniref:Uncharacterized protein n=1 Tax=Salmonella typhimurium (strain 14028s / SGSC 2262) TaxID=588858 RepID=A0A0F6B5G8_SALT1|nr:hypothetical protein STM14_3342 [Salmonella enterica subsp. enterica serovar Typhimurium str. 14028S]